MGIWSWLFPSDEDRLAKARALMADGKHAQARKVLLHCHHADAEKLYDECTVAVDRGEAASYKKQLKAEGFHGWKVEVTVRNAKLKAELEALIAEELQKAGVDLHLPQIDEGQLPAAVRRAQRRTKTVTRETGPVRLVPIVDGNLARQMAAQQQKG
jgi:hypothetical protein